MRAALGNRGAAWLLGAGLIDLAMFLYPLIAHTVWPAEVLMVIVGVPGAFIMACLMTLLQPPVIIGRVLLVMSTLRIERRRVLAQQL